MDELDRIDSIKSKLLVALEESKGIVSHACNAAGCSRASFYVYMNRDPDFREKVNFINEGAIDFVESQLLKNIEMLDTTSIIFFLKTRGRKRGYSEKEPLVEPELEKVSKSVGWTIIDPKTSADVNMDIGGAND